MGGSRYIRLRTLLACYILACLVPTCQVNPESLAGSAAPLCETCLLGSDDQILQSAADSTNLSDTLFAGLLSRFNHTLWSSDVWSKLGHSLGTLKDQHKSFSLHSHKLWPARWFSWISVNAQIHKKVYNCYGLHNVILLYGFFIYCCAYNKRARKEHHMSSEETENTTTSEKNQDPTFLTNVFSMLPAETNQGISANEKSGYLPRQYHWIFKYSNMSWQNEVLVYPVHSATWPRIASYSKLAFLEVPGTVSYLQLSSAGFKYTGHNFIVTCDSCCKSLNISDFTSSPSDAKYHEVNCRFAKFASAEKEQVVDSDQWSSTSDTALSPLSETMFHKETSFTSQVQPAQEIQTSGQLPQSLTTDLLHLYAAPYAHSDTSPDIPSHIPCDPSISSCAGGEDHVRHDLEDDGPNEVPVTSPGLDGCLDGTTKSVPVADHGTPETCITHSSRDQHTPVSSARDQHTPVSRARDQHTPVSSARDQYTPVSSARDQHTPVSSASGPNYTSLTQPTFVDTVDFQPEVHYCDREVQPSEISCSKNPGHYSYFPMGNFRLEYIPSNVRCPEVFSFFSLVAKLTVRVVVSATSSKRLWLCPATKFKCGTGFAVSKPGLNYQIPNTEHSGKVSGVRKFLPYGRKHGYIYIETNRHLVRDECEAENTIVEFFYDRPNRRNVVVARAVAVYHSRVQGDLKSVLVCRTSDMTLVNMVKECSEDIESMARNFPQNIKEGMMRRIFLLNHPHGGEKVFSFGEYVMVKYRLETTSSEGQTVTQLVKMNSHTDISQNFEDVRKMLLYSADTCPGSAGGVVVSFKNTASADVEDIILDLWMHNGVDVKHGLSASTIRTVTADDLANQGRQNVFRPSIQDDMAAEADRRANQVVTSPVFTVSQPPCHPAYVTYRKRLESYPVPFVHVHKHEDLADAGFFFANYADCVRCFHCGLGLKSWRQGDVIHEEHFRNRSDCQFLLLKLRESGIDVSVLEARLLHSRSHRTDMPAAASESGRQNTDQSHAVLNTEPTVQEMSHNTHTEEMSNNTHTEDKAFTETFSKNTNVCPQPQEVTVNYVFSSPAESRDDRRGSAVMVLEREQYYLKQIFNCKVCCKNQVKDLFLPCGELVACADCSKLLTHCPSCSKKILATVTTYFS